MSKDFYLNPLTHDIDLVNKAIRLTQTPEESARQQILIYLRTFKGELFFDITSGIAYLKNDNNPLQFLGDTNTTRLDVAIQTGIITRENIKKVEDYSSTFDKSTRVFSVTFKAITNNGEELFIESFPLST